ncbi:MAG: sialidase family protein [Vicinamibacterales bacterium]
MRIVLMLLLAVALVSSRDVAGADADVTLAVAGRVNLTPWIASDGDFVVVTWGARTPAGVGDVFVAVSRDAGVSFGPPVQVNTRIGEARLSGETGPRVAVHQTAGAADPQVVVLWNAKVDGRTEIRSARSLDAGRTFGAPVTLQTAGAAGDRGWPALAVDGDGAAHALWLDHRAMADPAGAHQHAGHDASVPASDQRDGVAMAQKSGLYYARVGAAGVTADRELVKGVCYCCKTALATGAPGSLFAAWRQVYAGNIRDIAFAQSRDGGKTFSAPVRISDDGWQLDGCPDDGPAIVVDRAETIHIVWPTVIGGANPEGALFYTSTRDGRTFTPRQRIPTLGSPKPSHPQIGQDRGGRLYVAWDEVRNGVRSAAMRTLTVPQGKAVFGEAQAIGTGSGAYPVMAAAPRGLLVAWTSGAADQSTIKVHRVAPPARATAAR